MDNVGLIDPMEIQAYLDKGGYGALKKAVTTMTPEAVVEEVKTSGIRGRGGAGFPAGLKWSFTRPLAVTPKYLVCNADEGEPGTIKDRYLMEGDPHKVLEGMAIAGFAVGASHGFIYCRGEYYLSKYRLENAIKQATARGFLGEKLFGTDFSFTIEVRSGFGCYICGEETALIESVEGKRGYPRLKPPFPGVSGLWGRPTVVNNVETLASVPAIINLGGAWYKNLGTPDTSGTKIYQIIGHVQDPPDCRSPGGHDPPGVDRHLRRRSLTRPQLQDVPDRRRFRRPGDRRVPGCAHGLRLPVQSRRRPGLRHHAGDGRLHLRGGFPAGRGHLLRPRVLRPVHPMPGRDAPPAPDPHPHLPGPGEDGGPGLPGTVIGYLA